MPSINDKMEYCFLCSSDKLKALSSDAEWRVRYAAAVAIGVRKDRVFLPELERILDIEDARPLYSQPVTQFIGTSGDTTLAEQVKPFQVVFPFPVDEDTQEAWKTRGRIKQAALYAIYDINSANEALIQKMHHYIADDHEDATVRAAAVRALGKVGDRDSLPYCEMAEQYDEWCTRMEAKKAIGVLKNA